MYSAGGEVVGEFATQRRIVITYDQISPVLRQAIIAAEDGEFNTHMGVSMTRIVVTLVRDICNGASGGASTLTQQLTRKLFLNDEKTWERKIKEAMLALQIEKRYTKNEIITLYCNQIPWGHGTYGVEAAARLYFGKSAKDVTLEEAALLAGIIQAPARHSPYVNMENACAGATTRSTGWPTRGSSRASAAEQAKKTPIVTVGRPHLDTEAPFFVEDVRQQLEERYGAQQLYENGLSVYTTLDLQLQRAAEAALDEGLRTTRQAAAASASRPRNVAAEQRRPSRPGRDPSWTPSGRAAGRHVDRRVVTGVDGPRAIASASARCTASSAAPPTPGPARRPARSSSPAIWSTLARRRRSTRRPKHDRGHARSGAGGRGRAARDQQPHRPDPGDGRRPRASIAAGSTAPPRRCGSSARRSSRSSMPPRSIAASRRRRIAASTRPVVVRRRPGQPPYAPLNYDKQFEGPITLRHALEQSRNVPDGAPDGDSSDRSMVIAYAAAARVLVDHPAVPVVGARLVRGDAPRGDRAPSPCSPTRASA